MSSAAIIFDDVWKKFQRGERHDSLRDLIPALAKRLVGRTPPEQGLGEEEFWAVRGVSFEVKPGEVLGIIGPNGAGKSTILKLLTKILRPTHGSCRLHGRVGALIEVSAAFHPDLTGRENVYLQGGIMGMRRADIARKFDEIVEFSGLSSFIDTPVKRYSSGMNARLGFAIASHVDADVLIIDEVLSVGDFAFQQKALDRIRELVKQQIPVVLVSHQLEAVNALCSHAIVLEKGAVAAAGRPSECISRYVGGLLSSRPMQETDRNSAVTIDAVTLSPDGPVRSGHRAHVTISGSVEGDLGDLEPISIRVHSVATREAVFSTGNTGCGVILPDRGPFEVRLTLQMNVPPGLYIIQTGAWSPRLGHDVSAGPSVAVTVEEGVYFWGTVQLNARMQLVRLGFVGAADGSPREESYGQ